MAQTTRGTGRGDEARRVRELVARAFDSLPPPAKWALSGSLEGTEGEEVAAAFAPWSSWKHVGAEFLNAQPKNGGPLTFLSDEGFRHFLPAYLIADLDGALDPDIEPEWHLTSVFTAERRDSLINDQRYGARTWGDEGAHRFSVFTTDQAVAIVAYLRWKATKLTAGEPADIAEALDFYWLKRTGEPRQAGPE